MSEIRCPFIYADGKQGSGKVVRVEAYRADAIWQLNANGEWDLSVFPRTHFHLFCSAKENHAGCKRQDDARMELWGRDLPEELQRVIGEHSSLSAWRDGWP